MEGLRQLGITEEMGRCVCVREKIDNRRGIKVEGRYKRNERLGGREGPLEG